MIFLIVYQLRKEMCDKIKDASLGIAEGLGFEEKEEKRALIDTASLSEYIFDHGRIQAQAIKQLTTKKNLYDIILYKVKKNINVIISMLIETQCILKGITF
jgi:hypothetical protein